MFPKKGFLPELFKQLCKLSMKRNTESCVEGLKKSGHLKS